MSFFEGSSNIIITGGEYTGVQVENGGTFTLNKFQVTNDGRIENTDVRVGNVENFNNVRVDKIENTLVDGKKGLDILQPHVAMSAVHNSGQRFDPPNCHPSTRTATIARIERWIMSTGESKIFWLHGALGAGKSALAQALAELCYRQPEVILIGTFFFSRTSLGDERGNGNSVVATLVYQILQAIPEVKPFVERALVCDPLIFGRSLEVQFQELLIEPLLFAFPAGKSPPQSPLLIILDGLDECDPRNVQSYLVETIHKMILMAERLPLKILVASRPEIHIREIFRTIKNSRSIEEFNLSRALDVHQDIYQFITEQCTELKKNHRMRQYIADNWPSNHIIELIIFKSSGHFIYAATVMKYVQSYRHLPHERMDIILGLAARPTNSSPLADLDALYAYILEQAEDFESVARVLAIMLLPSPDTDYGRSSGIHADERQRLTPGFLETLLFLPPGRLELLLTDLVSIVNMEDSTQPISFFHASFPDYLCDRSRSGQFYLGDRRRTAHADLARGLAYYVSLRGARFTIPLGHPFNSDVVTDLQTYTTKVMSYYATFFFHYAHAKPTSNFYSDLLEFDFVSSFRVGYTAQHHRQELSLTLMFYSEFLAILEDNGVQEAVSRNMHAYYNCIEQFLHFYKGRLYPGSGDALALADYDIDSVTVYTMQHILQSRSPSVWAAVSQNGLHLGRLVLVWPSIRGRGMFQRALLEILWDPKKSERSTLSAEKRLNALIRCLQSFCMTQGTTLEGIDEFDLTGITGPSNVSDTTRNDLWQNRILTELALLSRSLALLSKIRRGTPTARKLHLIYSENYDMIQQILSSNKLHVSTSAKAAASELNKAISDFLIENDQTVAQYRRPYNHLMDSGTMGSFGGFFKTTIANFKRR